MSDMLNKSNASYMVCTKNSVGAYRQAFSQSLKAFSSKDPEIIAKNSGAIYNSDRSIITLSSLGQTIEVQYPNGDIYFANTKKSPLWQWRLIILNYLGRADGTPLFTEPISYRELEDGHIFYLAFLNSSINPLSTRLARENPTQIKEACQKLGATLENKADICATFDFLPRFPITIKLWLEDEELGSSANILFNAASNHYLHTEDIAVAGELVSDFLIKECKKHP